MTFEGPSDGAKRSLGLLATDRVFEPWVGVQSDRAIVKVAYAVWLEGALELVQVDRFDYVAGTQYVLRSLSPCLYLVAPQFAFLPLPIVGIYWWRWISARCALYKGT